jgi:Flp pilus assembly protein TadD
MHLQRGIQLHLNKKYLQAQGDLIRALRADPKDWKAPFYLGAGKFERKKYAAAVPFLERALSLAPTEQKIYKMLGVIYYKLGQLDMARGYFTAYFELDLNNKDARGMIETMAKLQRSTALAATKEIN